MADTSAIDTSTFDYNPEELKDFSKVIHELLYADPELERLHMIEEGVGYDTQIVLASNKGLMGKKVTGCTPNPITGVTMTDKFWRPVKEDFRLEHCSASADEQNKLINMFTKLNPDFYDIFGGSNSKVGAYLIASVLERLKPEILRKAWFNDTLAKTVATGGVITNGTDLGYFNTFDGFFKQFFSSPTLSTKNRVDISAKQSGDLVLGDGKAILKAMYSKADVRLRKLQGNYFGTTLTIYDQYMEDLEDIENKGAGNIATTENGKLKLLYRGIEVIPIDLWDRVIEEYEADTTDPDNVVYNLPHRAVLTVPDNVRIATLSKDDFGTVDAFYDKVTKKNYIDGIYSIDAKIIEDYKIVMAY